MAVIALISEDQVKQLTPISTNVTITTPLKQSIIEAQEGFLYPILCKELYDRVQSELPTPSPEIQALIEAARPMLAWYTFHTVLPFAAVKLREQGPINQVNEHGAVVNLDYLTWLRGEVLSSCERWTARLERFLVDNAADYPEWASCGGCGCSGEGGAGSSQVGGPAFGGFMMV